MKAACASGPWAAIAGVAAVVTPPEIAARGANVPGVQVVKSISPAFADDRMTPTADVALVMAIAGPTSVVPGSVPVVQPAPAWNSAVKTFGPARRTIVPVGAAPPWPPDPLLDDDDELEDVVAPPFPELALELALWLDVVGPDELTLDCAPVPDDVDDAEAPPIPVDVEVPVADAATTPTSAELAPAPTEAPVCVVIELSFPLAQLSATHAPTQRTRPSDFEASIQACAEAMPDDYNNPLYEATALPVTAGKRRFMYQAWRNKQSSATLSVSRNRKRKIAGRMT